MELTLSNNVENIPFRFFDSGKLIRSINRLKERRHKHQFFPPGLPNPSESVCFVNCLLQGLSSLQLLNVAINRLYELCVSTTFFNTWSLSGNVEEDSKTAKDVLGALRAVVSYLNNDYFNHLSNEQLQPQEKPPCLNHIELSRLTHHFRYLRKKLEERYDRIESTGRSLHRIGFQDAHEFELLLLDLIRIDGIHWIKWNFFRLPLMQQFRLIATGVYSFALWPNFGLLKTDLNYCQSCAFMERLDRSKQLFENFQNLLEGLITYQTKCLTCHWISSLYTTSFVMLEIQLNTNQNIENCLIQFLRHEFKSTKVDDVNCPNCFLNFIQQKSILTKLNSSNETKNSNATTLKSLENVSYFDCNFSNEIRKLQFQLLEKRLSWESIVSRSPLLKNLLQKYSMLKSSKLNSYQLKSLPHCLTIHLQRHQWNYGVFMKRMDFIQFPLLLNLDSFFVPPDRNPTSRFPHLYELRAVIEHVGKL